MNMKSWKRMVLVGAVAVAAWTGVVHAGVSDAWISTKVKMSLMTSDAVSGMPIHVDTDRGRVTLYGKVATAAEKAEAGRIARTKDGVVAVRNLLQIVPKSQRDAVHEDDEHIKQAVLDALKAEPALANSEVDVQSVSKGVVLLNGKASSMSDHLLAIEVASEVAGVRRVASEIQSPDQLADREVWYDPNPSDPHGNVVTDAWITAQTKVKFMTDDLVPARDINVDTRRGTVTLFGTVPSQEAEDKALEIARAVPGVRSVNRELRVVPASLKKSATANDGAIASAVRKRIADARIEGADVHVEVKARTARLTGTVKTAADRYAAISIASETPGVARVVSDVNLDTSQATAR